MWGKELCSYWARVIRRGLSESARSADWKAAVLSVVLFIIGTLIHWLRFGRDEAMNETETWLSYTLAPIAGLAVLFIAYNIFRAPALMDRELSRERDGAVEKLGKFVGNTDAPLKLIIGSGRAFCDKIFTQKYEFSDTELYIHWSVGVFNGDSANSLQNVRVIVDRVDGEYCSIPLLLDSDQEKSSISPQETCYCRLISMKESVGPAPLEIDWTAPYIEEKNPENQKVWGYIQNGELYRLDGYREYFTISLVSDQMRDLAPVSHNFRVSAFADNTPRAMLWFHVWVDSENIPRLETIKDEAEVFRLENALVQA